MGDGEVTGGEGRVTLVMPSVLGDVVEDASDQGQLVGGQGVG